MKLRPLIKNQKIRIDAHQRGNGHYDVWDKNATDIHIDKRTNRKYDGKPVEAVLRIPINSPREVTCQINKRENTNVAAQIRKEVQEVFLHSDVANDFVKDLSATLRNYPSELGETQKAQRALQRIADYFDLNEQMVTQIIRNFGSEHDGLKIRYRDGNKVFYAAKIGDTIQIGQETPSEQKKDPLLVRY